MHTDRTFLKKHSENNLLQSHSHKLAQKSVLNLFPLGTCIQDSNQNVLRDLDGNKLDDEIKDIEINLVQKVV